MVEHSILSVMIRRLGQKELEITGSHQYRQTRSREQGICVLDSPMCGPGSSFRECSSTQLS